jgi:hypothetical protein
MTQLLLNILIPTVIGREKEFAKLSSKIEDIIMGGNLTNEVRLISLKDNKQNPIGYKREELYKMASALYSWQIDDDDDIADNAIQLILEAIKSNPEIPCITFKERCIMNGEYKSSNHSIRYEKWQDNFDGYDYVRCPFYKDVIRTDIAKSVPFPKIRYNEDEQWSMAIKQLLTDEIHIEEELYYYIYEPKESHEKRYGIE